MPAGERPVRRGADGNHGAEDPLEAQEDPGEDQDDER